LLDIDAAEPSSHRIPWNKGRLIGQKRPLKPKEVWVIRVRLQLEQRRRDLALLNLAIDSKLRGRDLVRLQINDVCVGGRVRDRATVIQRKTGRPVQFEITEQTRSAIRDWLANGVPGIRRYLFPSRFHDQPHISTRQYARIVHSWMIKPDERPCLSRGRCDRGRRFRHIDKAARLEGKLSNKA
jgi:integrase